MSSFPFLLLLVTGSLTSITTVECQRTYIVHMDITQKPKDLFTHEEWYSSKLQSLLSVDPSRHLLYTYTTALHGFAVVLHPEHVPIIRSHPSVLHVHLDPLLQLHTTHSPHFLGLFDPTSTSLNPTFASAVKVEDVIVEVLDTGVWPEANPGESEANPCQTRVRHGSLNGVSVLHSYNGYQNNQIDATNDHYIVAVLNA